MKRETTCIICPNGCDIVIDEENGKILTITGNTCHRGEVYAKEEMTAPKRTIASSVLVDNGVLPLASVRTVSPIPKEKIFAVMEKIKHIRLTAPVEAGTIIDPDILHLGSALITTKDVAAKEQH